MNLLLGCKNSMPMTPHISRSYRQDWERYYVRYRPRHLFLLRLLRVWSGECEDLTALFDIVKSGEGSFGSLTLSYRHPEFEFGPIPFSNSFLT